MSDHLIVPSAERNIYATIDRLLEQSGTDESIRIANGLSYQRAFSPWFSDWQASESQALIQHIDDLMPFPGIKALKDARPKQGLIPPISAQKELLELRMYNELFYPTIDKIVESIHAYHVNDLHLSQLLEITPDTDNLAAFNQYNISQHYRDKQIQISPYAFQFYSEAMELLMRLCESHNWDIHLRPIFSMQSSMSRQIHASMGKNGFTQPDLYMSPGQMKVWDRFKRNKIQLPESVWETKKHEYWNWYYRASYMYLEDKDSEIEIHFGPWNLPPTFFARPTDSAPYFMAAPRGTFHTGHAIHYLNRFYSGSSHAIELITQSNQDGHPLAIMADLMPVICGCLTLISLTTQTGQGQHKPTWTQAPFNIAMIRIFLHACALAISNARKAI